MRPAEPDPPLWTVEQAAAYFAAAGIPVDPRRLAVIIGARGLAWTPVGETRPGEKGGRGKALYPVQDFQDLHRDLAEWLIRIPQPEPGATPEGQ